MRHAARRPLAWLIFDVGQDHEKNTIRRLDGSKCFVFCDLFPRQLQRSKPAKEPRGRSRVGNKDEEWCFGADKNGSEQSTNRLEVAPKRRIEMMARLQG